MQNFLNANSAEYEHKLAEQRVRIGELVEENKRLLARLEKFIQSEQNIALALTEAQKKAAEIRACAQAEYDLAAKSLRIFLERWKDYFDRLKEKYPLYPAAKQAEELRKKLSELLMTGDNRKMVEQLSGELQAARPSGEKFDPKKLIERYVAATESNCFSLEEVLNPGELKLEDLCKELGLIEEK